MSILKTESILDMKSDSKLSLVPIRFRLKIQVFFAQVQCSKIAVNAYVPANINTDVPGMKGRKCFSLNYITLIKTLYLWDVEYMYILRFDSLNYIVK